MQKLQSPHISIPTCSQSTRQARPHKPTHVLQHPIPGARRCAPRLPPAGEKRVDGGTSETTAIEISSPTLSKGLFQPLAIIAFLTPAQANACKHGTVRTRGSQSGNVACHLHFNTDRLYAYAPFASRIGANHMVAMCSRRII